MDVTRVSTPSGEPGGPSKALEDALDAFKAILKQDQRDKLSQYGAIQGAETVMIFTAQLDRENQLNKGRGIATRLISVLQSVQAFSAVVDTFISAKPEVAALVWGSIKFTMHIAVNYTSYFEALSKLFMSFGNHCPRFAEYQTLYKDFPRLQMALCDFNASIVRCCKHIVEAIQRPWQKQIANAFWQSVEQEFAPDVKDIQHLAKEVKDEIQLAKTQVEYQEQKIQEAERAAAGRDRSRMRRFVPRLERKVDNIENLQLQQSIRLSAEERQRLLESLSSYDHLSSFTEACKKRQYGTAEWILDAPGFSRWYSRSGPPVLWCSGKIGAGKTVLCANVISHIYRNKSRHDHVAFFFAQSDNCESLKAETTIRSIIRQSIDATKLAENVERRLKELTDRLFVDFDDWVGLARQVLRCLSEFYIIVDGLDESDAAERRALLDALVLLTSAVPTLRVFIASRDSLDVDLRSRFSNLEHISMSPDILTSDISLYVEATVRERIENEDLMVNDPCLKDEIKETLTQHADGMFLWVTFLISELCTASCDDDIRHFLRTLPKDLEETYGRALSRIITRQKMADLSRKVFLWVAAAKEPLNLEEIREALSIEIGQESSSPGRRVREMSRIILWCENLLQITEDETPSVQFAHISIRDFLVEASLPPQLASFHIDLEEADHFVGEICVTYLHFNDFKTTICRIPQPFRVDPRAMAETALGFGSTRGGLMNRLTELPFRGRRADASDFATTLVHFNRSGVDGSPDDFQISHPFLHYATTHWLSHTSSFRNGKSRTWSLWQDMVNNGHNLAHMPWEEIRFEKNNAIFSWAKLTRHYALQLYSLALIPSVSMHDRCLITSAFQGDTRGFEVSLEAARSLRKQSMDGIHEALQVAAGCGHLQIVTRILAIRSIINAPDREKGGLQIPLWAASETGQLQVVVALLEAGANVDPNTDEVACLGRYLMPKGTRAHSIEEMLAAASVRDAVTSNDWTSLQLAAKHGHVLVVERLLTAKADIHKVNNSGRTALQLASEGGHHQIVRRLLDNGAIVDAPDDLGRTPLQLASEGGHFQIMEQLLAAGADIDAFGAARYRSFTRRSS